MPSRRRSERANAHTRFRSAPSDDSDASTEVTAAHVGRLTYEEIGEEYIKKKMVGYWVEPEELLHPTGPSAAPVPVTAPRYPGEDVLSVPGPWRGAVAPPRDSVDPRYIMNTAYRLSATYPYDEPPTGTYRDADGVPSPPRPVTKAADDAADWFQDSFWDAYDEAYSSTLRGGRAQPSRVAAAETASKPHYRTWPDPWHYARQTRRRAKQERERVRDGFPARRAPPLVPRRLPDELPTVARETGRTVEAPSELYDIL
eukprot:Rhum_TRINITY_DN16624_c0_g1::Rhum_TRINITY_DN16624_c0_g1_i1::g.163887::m.163887